MEEYHRLCLAAAAGWIPCSALYNKAGLILAEQQWRFSGGLSNSADWNQDASAGIFSSSCLNLLQQPALCHSWVLFFTTLRGILKITTDTKQEEEERSRGPEVSTAGFRRVEKGPLSAFSVTEA